MFDANMDHELIKNKTTVWTYTNKAISALHAETKHPPYIIDN